MGWFEGDHGHLIGDELADIIGPGLDALLVECQMSYPDVTPAQFLANVAFASGHVDETYGLKLITHPTDQELADAFNEGLNSYDVPDLAYVEMVLAAVEKVDTEPEDYDRFVRTAEGFDDDPELDLHIVTAMKMFGVEADEVTFDQRRVAKILNVGVLYGAKNLTVTEEGQI